MALNPVALAGEIADALDQPSPTPQLIGWATGVLTHVLMGVASFGGIKGPHPIAGLIGDVMANLVAQNCGYPGTSPELIGFCNGITIHIMSAGKVTYAGPPPSTGNPDWFLGGKITGLDGAAMANLVAINMGQPSASPELTKKCTAIADHIMTNGAVVSGIIS